uniref:hypothetical protein n=1 Tax=Enterobacter asburiae TaxID=61645 RepID=UPI001E4B569C|nr:hypothetical protein [Enterobacter asburiae]
MNYVYLSLVFVGIIALRFMPADKNKLKNVIAILIGVFAIAYVIGVYTDHYGTISHETMKTGLPWFAAIVGYAWTAIIYVLSPSKQNASYNLGKVITLFITGGIMSLVLFFVTHILLTL